MNNSATGTFEVVLKPQTLFHETSPLLGRLSIDKTFHGDLSATSTGEMLSARTSVENSAGYVAIERVNGTLHGRKGTFVLQHSSTMTRGEGQQSITVVPDSGTDELVGLSGNMIIIVKDGKHNYEFFVIRDSLKPMRQTNNKQRITSKGDTWQNLKPKRPSKVLKNS
jgi:hypothetical protein